MKEIMINIFFRYLTIIIFVLSLFTSCEKDNITNAYIDDNPDRLGVIATDLKKALASSPNGWVMMVKSSLSEDVYTPIVLQFDTVKNKVHITTVYGETSEVDDFFRIAKGTGAPQLIFTTGSIMTTLYRIGAAASNITDHIYNVKSVSDEAIEIQPYRSGNVYSKEGGAIFKLFKRPDSWTWADKDIVFDWTSDEFKTDINSVIGEMKIKYSKENGENKYAWRFWSWSNPTVYRIRDPFAISTNIGTGGFNPGYYFIITGEVTNDVNTTVTLGHNAISMYPFSYNNGTNQAVTALTKKLKTHYLVFKSIVRTGSNVKLEFEAYDKDGNVSLQASYDNKR